MCLEGGDGQWSSASDKDVEIPVLLADAVYSPAPHPDGDQKVVEYSIVRNFFWSATAGQFDAIVGNPPWVRWSNLPEAYRNRAKPTCEKYAIFSDTKFHGGNELDISAIITYTTADKWLVEDGRLVFVITQTVFQSPSSQGFRRFRINATDRLVPISIDDMKELKPFPDAANKTAVAMFTKKIGGTTRYPLDYRVWLGKPKTDNAGNPKKGRGGQVARLKAIDPRLHRAEVAKTSLLAREREIAKTATEGVQSFRDALTDLRDSLPSFSPRCARSVTSDGSMM